MKELTITYAGATIYSGPVEEFTWTDSADAVTVTGKTRPVQTLNTGKLLELLAASRRRNTQQFDTADIAEETGATPHD